MSTLAAPSRLVPRSCTGGQGQIMHGSQPSFCFNDMNDRSLKQIYIDLHWFRFRLIYIVVWVYMFVFHIISCHSIRFWLCSTRRCNDWRSGLLAHLLRLQGLEGLQGATLEFSSLKRNEYWMYQVIYTYLYMYIYSTYIQCTYILSSWT